MRSINVNTFPAILVILFLNISNFNLNVFNLFSVILRYFQFLLVHGIFKEFFVKKCWSIVFSETE